MTNNNADDVNMEEYEKMSKLLSADNKKASVNDLKTKLNYLAKQKFEMYTLIEKITAEEKEINNIIAKKSSKK